LKEECFDRKDYSEDTGLYHCKDGSQVGDWRDCDDDKDNTDADGLGEDESEEETENCGGEPCTATEKEDSTLDDEPEYFENDDGSLGEPITDEEEIEEIDEVVEE
jgi:hypothetical protein